MVEPLQAVAQAGQLQDDPTAPAIVAAGVERVFGTGEDAVHALGPLDLEVPTGEFLSIVGPSGCGKSTFLRILAGLINPTAGRVDMTRRSDSGRLCAMVFQDYAIYPWKTVEANVRLALDLEGVPRQEANERVHHWLAKLGIADFAQARPAALSGGMRQRVSIARALAAEPDILLMDEPFAALDAQLREVLQDELLRLWEADRRTVVFITHSIDEALVLSDRVAVISHRPGVLLSEHVVPLPRPRDADVRSDPAFAALRSRIWQELRSEVDQSSQAQATHRGAQQ